MAVPVVTYGSEIWIINHQNNRNQNFETAEITFLWSAAGYTRRDQIRNTKIGEELNVFNLNNKFIKLRSQWKYHFIRMEDDKF
jgi:hypothetical protein